MEKPHKAECKCEKCKEYERLLAESLKQDPI